MEALVSSALTIRLSLQPSPASETSAFNQARLQQPLCRTLPDQRLQLGALFRAQPDHIFLYRHILSSHARLHHPRRLAANHNVTIHSNYLKRATSCGLFSRATRSRKPVELAGWCSHRAFHPLVGFRQGPELAREVIALGKIGLVVVRAAIEDIQAHARAAELVVRRTSSPCPASTTLQNWPVKLPHPVRCD